MATTPIQEKNGLCFRAVRYQLVGDLELVVSEDLPELDISFLKIESLKGGRSFVRVRAGFAWDGASRCPDWGLLRASCVHDVLYHAMRANHLPWVYQISADRIFYEVAKESVPSWWAWLMWQCLKLFGRNALRNPRKVRSR